MKKTGAPHELFVRRVVTSSANGIRNRLRPRRVVTGNPDLMMVTPSPMAGDPIPARAVIPIPRPVPVIWAIADFDIEADRLCRHRSKRSRAKERGQETASLYFIVVFLSSY